ncbi:hypothetical protein Bpla01_35240 [Burkholderia plantarii]|nr:hypothetical protein Bpla01_35240 [Burkholderia plantarii]
MVAEDGALKPEARYHCHRFPAAIISQAIRWYFRFLLSVRDIEGLRFEHGVIVSYETIHRWRDKFGATFARRVKAARRKPGRTWYLDEMFVSLRGEPWLPWRAVDEHGTELDILLRKRRDEAAAKRFSQRVLRSFPAPRKIVTDPLRSYPAAKAGIRRSPTSGMCS